MALLRKHIVTLNKIFGKANYVSACQAFAVGWLKEGWAYGRTNFYSTKTVTDYPAIHRSQRWWIIDGEIYPIGPQLRPQVVSPSSGPPVSKKERRLARARHLSRIRITESGSQEIFWKRYMEAYQRARAEWEKLVCDKPKRDLFDDFDEDDEFFDKIVEKKKKKKKVKEEEDGSNSYTAERRSKPFSREEIQVAFQEDYRRSFAARSPIRKGFGDVKSYSLSR